MKIDYTNSGIKTLRFASPLLFLCGIVAAALLIPEWFITNRIGDLTLNWATILQSFIYFSLGLVSSAVGLVLATIAENTLYQKQKDENNERREEE